jgi:hypothetical protein
MRNEKFIQKFVGKSERVRSLGSHSNICDDNIKMDFKDVECACGLHSSASVGSPNAYSSKYFNEPLNYLKGDKCLALYLSVVLVVVIQLITREVMQ